MPFRSIPKLTLLLLTILFFMPKESPAQKKPAKTPKPSPVAVKPVPPEISYTVSMPKPATHLLEVEMRVSWSQMPDKTELKMPVWTPGSYLVREYARHVQDFAVKDEGGGNLSWRKVNKNTWQVDTKGATAKVSLLNGVDKSEATLAPAGGNKLEAKGSFNVKSGTKVTAVVTLAGKEAKTVRVFVP